MKTEEKCLLEVNVFLKLILFEKTSCFWIGFYVRDFLQNSKIHVKFKKAAMIEESCTNHSKSFRRGDLDIS